MASQSDGKVLMSMGEILTDITRAGILEAINDLSEAPQRIYNAATSFTKLQHDYIEREADLTVTALSNPDLKNDMQRKAAVEYALTHDILLTQWNSGLVTKKAALERERNRLTAATTIIRAMELLSK